MQKCTFLVSNLERRLNKQETYAALDAYIAINNPELDIRVSAPLRTNMEECKKYIEIVDQKYEQYVTVLMDRLNDLHDVEFNKTYWRQQFYLGLKGYITRVYEFYMQVSSRFSPEHHEVQTLDKESFFTPFDLQELNDYLSNSELAQEQLFTIYMETFYEQLQLPTFEKENSFRNIKQEKKVSFKYKTAHSIFQLMRFRKPSILLVGVNYDKTYLLKLLSKSFFKIFWLDFTPFQKSRVTGQCVDDRDFIAKRNESFDDFDKFFFDTLPHFFPKIFIEEYSSASNYYNDMCDQYKHLQYVISESWIGNSQLSFFIAHLRQRGIKFIYSEHKGTQHPFLGNYVYDLTKITDKYYTSGWYSKHYNKHENLIKTGLMHKVKGNKNIPELQNKILYFAAPAFAKKHSYNCMGSFMGEDGLEHFAYQKSFFQSISKDVLKTFVYRIAPIYREKNTMRYDQEHILQQYLQHVQIDKGEHSGIDSMHNAKLVVIDYLNSGYLESLLNNYPTLLFLNSNDYLDPSQEHIFEELIEAKIIHTSGESAGKFLMEIYDDPMTWWRSSKVQKARQIFIKTHLGEPEALLEEIFKLLKKSN